MLGRLINWIVPDWALRWGTDLSVMEDRPVAYVRDAHAGWTVADFQAASNGTTSRCPVHGTFGGSARFCRYPIASDGAWCGLPLRGQS